MEPGARGEFVVSFKAGQGTFTQQLHFFLDANGALHQRQLDVLGKAHPPSSPLREGQEGAVFADEQDRPAGNGGAER